MLIFIRFAAIVVDQISIGMVTNLPVAPHIGIHLFTVTEIIPFFFKSRIIWKVIKRTIEDASHLTVPPNNQ